jgi:ABC-type dipeptide/oligopeptide/nickel transport system permease component
MPDIYHYQTFFLHSCRSSTVIRLVGLSKLSYLGGSYRFEHLFQIQGFGSLVGTSAFRL